MKAYIFTNYGEDTYVPELYRSGVLVAENEEKALKMAHLLLDNLEENGGHADVSLQCITDGPEAAYFTSK